MLKKPMLLAALVLLPLLAALAATLFYRLHPLFGSAPSGERLARIQRSPHYVDGAFKNQIETPMLTTDESRLSLMLRNFSSKARETRPPRSLPSQKLDLRALDPSEDLIIWLGHSSFYVQLGGRRILIDPILSRYASPFPWVNRGFDGSDLYNAEELPPIDLLIITHDHYDHLDYPTARALRGKASRVVTALGVGAHLEAWGWPARQITELDWGDSFRDSRPSELQARARANVSEDAHGIAAADEGESAPVNAAKADGAAAALAREPARGPVEIIATPGRHFSGRTFKRSQTLWMGLVLRSPTRRLFFSGDTGYGPHFAEIGAQYGPFDWVTLDSGQYNDRWRYMHMRPEESAQAAEDLRARAFTPGHVGRFTISDHSWDDPFRRALAASVGRSYALWTPQLGQAIYLDGRAQHFAPWWEALTNEPE